MTREEVVQALGEPHDTGGTSRRHRMPCIYKYGDIELHFNIGRNGGLRMAYKEDEEGNGIILLQ